MSWWPSNLYIFFHIIMNSLNISDLQQSSGVNFCFWHKLSHCDRKEVPSSWSVRLLHRTIVIFQLPWFLTRMGIFSFLWLGQAGHTWTRRRPPAPRRGAVQLRASWPRAEGALSSPWVSLPRTALPPLLNSSSVKPLIIITSFYGGKTEDWVILKWYHRGAISQIQTMGQMTQFLQINGTRKGDGQVTEDLLTDSKSLRATMQRVDPIWIIVRTNRLLDISETVGLIWVWSGY